MMKNIEVFQCKIKKFIHEYCRVNVAFQILTALVVRLFVGGYSGKDRVKPSVCFWPKNDVTGHILLSNFSHLLKTYFLIWDISKLVTIIFMTTFWRRPFKVFFCHSSSVSHMTSEQNRPTKFGWPRPYTVSPPLSPFVYCLWHTESGDVTIGTLCV